MVQLFSQFLGKQFTALYLSERLSKHPRQHLINAIFKPGSSFWELIAWSLTAAVEQVRHRSSLEEGRGCRGGGQLRHSVVGAEPPGRDGGRATTRF